MAYLYKKEILTREGIYKFTLSMENGNLISGTGNGSSPAAAICLDTSSRISSITLFITKHNHSQIIICIYIICTFLTNKLEVSIV